MPQGLFASGSGCKTMDVRVDTVASADPASIMTTGGDGRIDLDPATGLNRYHSAPRPSEALAYASSTANDISPQAFAHVGKVLAAIGPNPSDEAYAAGLEGLRGRIRDAYGLGGDPGSGSGAGVAVVFAASGTDLEYVALAAGAGRAPNGTHNLRLGADEVGSGCIHSAHGH